MNYGIGNSVAITSGGSLTITPTNIYTLYVLTGTVSLADHFNVTSSGTFKEGSVVNILYNASVTPNAFEVKVFTLNIPHDMLNKPCAITAYYVGGAWKIVLTPNFAESGGGMIEGQILVDDTIEAVKFNATLDMSGKVQSNVDINSGTVDGVTIGGSAAGAITTTALVATTADINGGTIDGSVIGGNIPAAITGTTVNGTTITASVNFAGALTGNVTGIASSATKLQTARTIAGTSFDGTGNIDIAPENLLGVSAVAADIELLAGASAAGVAATDIQAIKDINAIMSVSGDNIEIATGKGISLIGTLYEGIKIVTGTSALDLDDTYVFAHMASVGTITLIDASTCEGKKVVVFNSGDDLCVVDSAGASVFVNFNSTTTSSDIDIQPPNSITVVSNGTDWEVINRTGGIYEYDNTTHGELRCRILKTADFEPLLDTTTNNAIKMRKGDIITNVRVIVETAAGAACVLSVGPDGSLRGAGLDADGFIKAADCNVTGIYESNDVATTYTGDRIKSGYFTCDDDGYIIVDSSTDQSASAFVGTLIVTYMPA